MSVCDDTCDRCRFATLCADPAVERKQILACDYIGATGKSRPCKAGARCTVREDSGRSRLHYDTLQKYDYHKRVAERLGGRQAAAIRKYMQKTGYSYKDIAAMLDLKAETVKGWAIERRPAKWELLAQIGIQKPEGID